MLSVDVSRRLGTFELRAAFEAGAGVTALFGRSGAGKSSLINAVAGLLTPERGRIVVDGITLFDAATGVDVPAHRRRIGYVFQEGRLFPHLTVRQNLLYGSAGGAIGLDQVVALLDIGPLLNRQPATLSGGEKQRVAIGRALLTQPRLLLMDEPLAALDAARKGEVLRHIERLRDELRVPIVYVSHAVEEVMRLADTVVLMEGGAVTASGPAMQVMSGWRAEEEGPATVLEAMVAAHDPAYGLSTLRFSGGELTTPDVDARTGERVRVRIRAQDVALALAPPVDTSISNQLRARITGLAAGAIHVDVSLDVGGSPLTARVTRRSADRLQLAEGLTVYALIKAVVLDRASVGYA
jgi:molybdate transport system ATP-binding protein